MECMMKCFKVLSCESFYKYVLNDCSCHSRCGENCCEFDMETNEVEEHTPPPTHTHLNIGGVLEYESE